MVEDKNYNKEHGEGLVIFILIVVMIFMAIFIKKENNKTFDKIEPYIVMKSDINNTHQDLYCYSYERVPNDNGIGSSRHNRAYLLYKYINSYDKLIKNEYLIKEEEKGQAHSFMKESFKKVTSIKSNKEYYLDNCFTHNHFSWIDGKYVREQYRGYSPLYGKRSFDTVYDNEYKLLYTKGLKRIKDIKKTDELYCKNVKLSTMDLFGKKTYNIILEGDSQKIDLSHYQIYQDHLNFYLKSNKGIFHVLNCFAVNLEDRKGLRLNKKEKDIKNMKLIYKKESK